ncbi:helix-turn-helix domain protein, partial [Rhizobium sp. PDO1-076]|uniref:helix-turn-helix domain-containing protein n=1 Tax=Rhizobium sp. PDO1-076 TaxID=1125979 RepID=UPI00024E38FE
RAVSEKTGIALGTLNKYVAMTSVPSVANAVKLANVAGVSVEYLATGVKVISPERDGDGWEGVEDRMSLEIREVVDPLLFERLFIAVEKAHKDAGTPAPSHRIALATGEVLNALRQRVVSLRDKPIVEAVIPVVLEDLRQGLEEAKRLPGSGKLTAS